MSFIGQPCDIIAVLSIVSLKCFPTKTRHYLYYYISASYLLYFIPFVISIDRYLSRTYSRKLSLYGRYGHFQHFLLHTHTSWSLRVCRKPCPRICISHNEYFRTIHPSRTQLYRKPCFRDMTVFLSPFLSNSQHHQNLCPQAWVCHNIFSVLHNSFKHDKGLPDTALRCILSQHDHSLITYSIQVRWQFGLQCFLWWRLEFP